MLKMTEISDLFIEKGMGGKYMQSYDGNEPSKFIVYLDANNLHGWAMSQYLAYGGFKWLNKREIDKFCLSSIGENSSTEKIVHIRDLS